MKTLEQHLQLAKKYEKRNLLAQALNEYKEAARLAPRRREIHIALGQIAFRINQLPLAERAFVTALTIDPSDLQTRFLLGQVYEAEGKFLDAEREYRYVIPSIPAAVERVLRLPAILPSAPPSLHQPFKAHNELEFPQFFTQQSLARTSNINMLEIIIIPDMKRSLHTLEKHIIDIGRHPNNDICIDEPFISGFHLQIVHEGGELVLIHPHPQVKQTANGLWYQKKQIERDELLRKRLELGDTFHILGNRKAVSLIFYDKKREGRAIDFDDNASIGKKEAIANIVKNVKSRLPDMATTIIENAIQAHQNHRDAIHAIEISGIQVFTATLAVAVMVECIELVRHGIKKKGDY